MPIKLEILADDAIGLMIQLRDMLNSGNLTLAQAQHDLQEAINTAPAKKTAEAQAVDQAKRAAAVKPVKAAPTKKKAAPTNGVKPLPGEDDDPLAPAPTEDETTSLTDEDVEAGALGDPPDPDKLIGEATEKLRDLFRVNSSGVRKLREKYGVTYFHQVPPARAEELWADTIKLEKELGA